MSAFVRSAVPLKFSWLSFTLSLASVSSRNRVSFVSLSEHCVRVFWVFQLVLLMTRSCRYFLSSGGFWFNAM